MGETKIPYVDKTCNVVIGCPDTGQPCLERCWANDLHTQRHIACLKGKHVAPQYAKPFSKLQILKDRIKDPLHWRQPRTILWSSMGDTFHEQVPFEVIDRMMAVVKNTPEHKHLFLTKRVEQEVEYFKNHFNVKSDPLWDRLYLGVSLMTQADVDTKLAKHLQIPGKHWVSAEPLLSEMDFTRFIGGWDEDGHCKKCGLPKEEGIEKCDCPPGFGPRFDLSFLVCGCEQYKRKPGRFLDGELTDKYYEARWWAAARGILRQCQAAGVKFWMKQGVKNGKVVTELKDMPEDMRIRQEIES